MTGSTGCRLAYAEMKWPHLAPHSRAGLADALATVTQLLTRETGRRPPPRRLRAALYGHAFNPQKRLRASDPATHGRSYNVVRTGTTYV